MAVCVWNIKIYNNKCNYRKIQNANIKDVTWEVYNDLERGVAILNGILNKNTIIPRTPRSAPNICCFEIISIEFTVTLEAHDNWIMLFE